jgi:hypothetical protein
MKTLPYHTRVNRSGNPEATAIERHVRSQLSGQIRDFRVIQHDNGLILCGWTRTYYAKQLAQHAVMHSTDVPILANEIQVF